MASMEFKAHHVGATKIGQQLNSSQTVCMYVCVCAAFRANAFYICLNFSEFLFSLFHTLNIIFTSTATLYIIEHIYIQHRHIQRYTHTVNQTS